jgi:predicted dehydrogenase
LAHENRDFQFQTVGQVHMTSRAIRYAMVGGGPGAMIGEAHRIAAAASGFHLAAGAFSSDPDRCRVQAERSGLPADRAYADWSSLLTDAPALAIEAAVVVTPNHLHADMIIAALNAGLHVISDKPLCITPDEASAIKAAATASGRIVGVTYTYAGYPALRRAAQMVAAGELGQIRMIQGEFIQDWLIDPHDAAGIWRLDLMRAGPGGTTADLGTHLFHLASFVTGLSPSQLSAELTSFVSGRTTPDTGLIRLRYGSGARGVLTVSQAAAAGARGGLSFRALGHRAGIGWRIETPDQLEFFEPGAKPDIIPVPDAGPLPNVPGAPAGFLNAFAALYADFAGAIRGEAIAYPNLQDGIQGVQFVDAAVASSARDGAWIAL